MKKNTKPKQEDFNTEHDYLLALLKYGQITLRESNDILRENNEKLLHLQVLLKGRLKNENTEKQNSLNVLRSFKRITCCEMIKLTNSECGRIFRN